MTLLEPNLSKPSVVTDFISDKLDTASDGIYMFSFSTQKLHLFDCERTALAVQKEGGDYRALFLGFYTHWKEGELVRSLSYDFVKKEGNYLGNYFDISIESYDQFGADLMIEEILSGLDNNDFELLSQVQLRAYALHEFQLKTICLKSELSQLLCYREEPQEYLTPDDLIAKFSSKEQCSYA
ncbi:hypothetical protein FWP33_13095 [Vibrio parahaemolyticus]|uniref:Uncharacterized protein n=2 Tax=Vibrio harveyi group TaxID=717610 RepID=A0A9Q3YG46_VIBPH|nr:hypothetical protein [Vibrio parahaemolyticus]CAH1592490.1 hypothetical protein THF1C08_320016 [Vibrio jasicida]EGQ9743443.1 hypothetical protein [Vibrio parahaemolyticus]EJE4724370.1 hypothetical protein [Vibrio parahaemolyticus]EJO2025552.1 hypothetical protein [Vibrio parahaemolyticus]MCC3803921.1 hypothetical protein [Vibrio parahaemolyticus]